MQRHRKSRTHERGCERIANALIQRITELLEVCMNLDVRPEPVLIHVELPRRTMRPGEARDAARLASQTLSRSCEYQYVHRNGSLVYRVYLST